MNKKSIIIILLVCVFYYCFCSDSQENMTDDATQNETEDKILDNKIRDAISKFYNTDIEAIRNLETIAINLQKNGLTIPGDLTVKGKLTTNNNLQVDGQFNYLPEGSIISWTGTKAPSGWALCDGGNGTPDLRGRFILGLGQGEGLTDRTINKTGGEETHTLSIKEMPSHNHYGRTGELGEDLKFKDDGDHKHEYDKPVTKGKKMGDKRDSYGKKTANTSGTGGHKHIINSQGGGIAHNNMPPFYVLAYIMKL